MIDLDKERKWVYKLLNAANMPSELIEDKFQEFAVYFYSGYNYKPEYKVSTYISIRFRNWLSQCAKTYSHKGRSSERDIESLDSKRTDYLDWVQSQHINEELSEQEIYLECERLFSQFTPLTQGFLMEKAGSASGAVYGYLKEAAKEEGVSRQAIEQRVARDMKKVLGGLK